MDALRKSLEAVKKPPAAAEGSKRGRAGKTGSK
jgi:hypothetical protein